MPLPIPPRASALPLRVFEGHVTLLQKALERGDVSMDGVMLKNGRIGLGELIVFASCSPMESRFDRMAPGSGLVIQHLSHLAKTPGSIPI